ncbi:MAG: DUF4065 domain-containing protein [Acetobacter sp.]|nr:DUF4065 domain-containing protein [Acetobacter sp.]MBQ3817679.1 DUF4065 domain-containing protein [Acetobacter sp.]
MSDQNSLAPSTAIEVANEFITLGLKEGIPIDQMKLQKLVYYAHAWHLALTQRPLFEEDIEAWPWGPVVRNIYIQTQHYGRDPISTKLRQLVSKNDDSLVTSDFVTPHGVKDELKGFIEKIWNTHKKYTGIQLSNSTHADGEPWFIVSQCYDLDHQKPSIPNSLIRDVFIKKINHE